MDGLAWIEIDDHEDLAHARDDVLARVASSGARSGSVWRYMELPRYLRAVHGRAELVRLLGEVTARRSASKRWAWSAARRTRAALAADLAAALPAVSAEPLRVEANTQAEVDRVAGVGRRERRTRSSRSGAARRSTSPSPPARAPICP